MKILTKEDAYDLNQEEWTVISNDFIVQLPDFFSNSTPIESRLAKLLPEIIIKTEDREVAVKLILDHFKKNYSSDVMEMLGKWFYYSDWYITNPSLLISTIDVLIERFKEKKVWSEEYVFLIESEIGMSKDDIINLRNNSVRWGISFSLEYILKPQLKSHKERYFRKLRELLISKELGWSRTNLIKPYCRMGKGAVIPDLLIFLHDEGLLQEAIPAVGRFRVKEAIPQLNNIIENKGFNPPINEELHLIVKSKARTAIRLINKG